MKNIIISIILLQIILLSACMLTPQSYGNNSAHANNEEADDKTTDFSLISNIDDYVNGIRENIEDASITKQTEGHKQKIVFAKDNDTVKISVITDTVNITSTDIYFQNSEPVFASRNIILDVDSSYMETVYFKDGELYKCFRNGVEVSDRPYAAEFMKHIEL